MVKRHLQATFESPKLIDFDKPSTPSSAKRKRINSDEITDVESPAAPENAETMDTAAPNPTINITPVEADDYTVVGKNGKPLRKPDVKPLVIEGNLKNITLESLEAELKRYVNTDTVSYTHLTLPTKA